MAIHFEGTREQLRQRAEQLAAILSGRQPDRHGIASSFLSAIGFAALSDIKEAYVIKSRGGTDAMGVQWPPLRPSTVANRRVGPGDIAPGAPMAEQIRQRQQVIEREMRRIRSQFRRQEGELFDRFAMSMDPEEARRRARQFASRRATQETGLTREQTLGQRDVEILRDTGVLLNSLSPGMLIPSGSGFDYRRPQGAGGDQQIFQLNAGKVIVGTNVEYAEDHQEGRPDRNLPRRQFLPDNAEEIPEEWWENWLDAAMVAAEAGIQILFEEG